MGLSQDFIDLRDRVERLEAELRAKVAPKDAPAVTTPSDTPKAKAGK